MKWMDWGPEDLDAASPEQVVEIVRCMKEEQRELDRIRNTR